MSDLYLPMCHSLKEKRHILSPILTRLRLEFNISITEYDHLDVWQSALIGIAIISNNTVQIEHVFNNVIEFVRSHWPDISISKDNLEIIR